MTALRLKTAAIVYGALTLLALAIGFFRENINIYHHPEGILTARFSSLTATIIGGAIGVAFGLIVAFATRFSVYRFSWAKTLHLEFRGLFGPIAAIDIFGFAIMSAVAEEFFFRGAVQPVIGIILSSLLFGAMHVAPNKRYLPWPIQACILGFALGGLFFVTGNLAAPIAAHFTINYQNLHFINRYNPEPELPRSLLQQRNNR